jgi:altronate hydrolase
MKVATNSEMYARLSEDMDIDAGTILSDGRSVAEVGEEIYRMWLRMASGEMTKSEAQGLGDYEFVPWQIGAVM